MGSEGTGQDILLAERSDVGSTGVMSGPKPSETSFPFSMQGSLRVNRFNPYEGYVGSESVGQDILLAGRAAMNRALDGDIVAVELLPEEQWVSDSAQLRKHDEAEPNAAEARHLAAACFNLHLPAHTDGVPHHGRPARGLSLRWLIWNTTSSWRKSNRWQSHHALAVAEPVTQKASIHCGFGSS